MFYGDCMACNKEMCPIDCFNKHIGSTIALQKCFLDVYVVGP